MAQVWLVGIDIGTQSCKVVVCDESLHVRGCARRDYPFDTPAPGLAEQPVSRWEAALAPAIGEALAAAKIAPADIAALAIAGQLDGCVAVDATGNALAPCLIWMDRRATLPPLPADFSTSTGQIADGSHLAAKARWLATRVSAARFHLPVSYLVEQLTGEVVLDRSHASTTMLWEHADPGQWSTRLLDCFGLHVGQLPRIAHAHEPAGKLTARGAKLTGLPVGVMVAVGTGDDFATPLGAGLISPARAVCVVGTAEVVGAMSLTCTLDSGGLVETHPYPAGGFFVEHPGWLSGGTLRWLRDLLGVADDESLDNLLAGIPAGANELTFLPALTGAMTPSWNADARGCFYGLTPAHGRGHLVRAVYEAMAFAEGDVLVRLRELGLPFADVMLLGGGARSQRLAQLRADATGLTHVMPHHTDTTAIGAAMLAAVAAQHVSDPAAAAALAHTSHTLVHPGEDRHALACAHERSHALFAALTPLWAGAATST